MTAIQNTPSITIGNVVIRQDAEGRYNLKDLHQAAGGEKRHQPGDWLRTQQTQDLISELQKGDVPGIPGTDQKQPVTIIQGGDPKKQGTYVVRELVYAYAMWISAGFHLRVIRTFDTVMTGHAEPDAPPAPLFPSEAQTLIEVIEVKIAHLPPGQRQAATDDILNRVQSAFRAHPYTALPRARFAEILLYITQMDLHCAPSAPVIDPNAYARITPAQQRQLTEAVQRAMCGWVFTNEHSQHAYNALRVIFHLEHIADLPAAEFERALFVVDQIKTMNWQFLSWISEVRDTYLKEYVMAGSPWTPWLKRAWKKQFKAALPPRPDWLEIQRQLSLPLQAPEVAHG